MIFNKTFGTSCVQCLKNLNQLYMKRNYSIVPDKNFLNDVSAEVYKPKKHLGRMDNSVVQIPDTFVKAILKVIEDYPLKGLIETGDKLARHLKGRMPPMEKEEFNITVNKIKEKVLNKHQNVILQSEEDEQRYRQMIKDKVNHVLKQKIYNWRPIKYDEYTSLVYLLGRAQPEYAVLTKIFGEIMQRDKEFAPRSVFDFGSGVGTVTWAVNAYWKNKIFEYFNVDSSRCMNDLAQILLQGGKGNPNANLKGTYFRQFLPATNIEYDLVTSAYSLMELPTLETRLETVLNLWNKTKDYLILVEQGTNAGFKIINEARDFILQIDKEAHHGHVFSPCPHDKLCPRFLSNDGTPCNFNVRYYHLLIGQNRQEVRHELYSYVVLKKGPRKDQLNWPRVIRPILVRSKHSICRVCSSNGKLEELIFTGKKHGKNTYHCARSSKWGDLLPVTIENDENTKCSQDKEIPEQNK